jgi:hypothetical protein
MKRGMPLLAARTDEPGAKAQPPGPLDANPPFAVPRARVPLLRLALAVPQAARSVTNGAASRVARLAAPVALAPVLMLGDAATAQTPSRLVPWGPTSTAASPWRLVGLPGGKVPLAQFDVTELDGARVLRVRSKASYGILTHPAGRRRADQAVRHV